MADWKQITARIRRARTGKDPAAQLTNLFTKTRDAMVAFELARYFESTGNPEDAGKWYLTAAERFRRSDWKTKAQESATRLGATVAAEIPFAAPPSDSTAIAPPEAAEVLVAPTSTPVDFTPSEAAPASPPETSTAALPHERRQRRGRRGGRDHPRSGRCAEHAPAPRESRPPAAPSRSIPDEPPPREISSRSLDDTGESPAPSLRGRSGDPGLSSRLSQLEMNFRRLLASTPAKVEEADRAPAGPGVWLLTDSDLTTYYYVEACQTLRVAIPNLARGGSARRGENPIKPLLADHLGIPESRVAKYISDHCVVRWLQMDDGASHFAHFLIAVLRPSLNE
jgi:hypothetical protein